MCKKYEIGVLNKKLDLLSKLFHVAELIYFHATSISSALNSLKEASKSWVCYHVLLQLKLASGNIAQLISCWLMIEAYMQLNHSAIVCEENFICMFWAPTFFFNQPRRVQALKIKLKN